MFFHPSDITLDEFIGLLDQRELFGPRRHVLIEVFRIEHIREWERPNNEDYFEVVLAASTQHVRDLLHAMTREQLPECSQDLRSGRISNISIDPNIRKALMDRKRASSAAELEHRRRYASPKAATGGVKRRVHEMFEETCEICGDQAFRGKDKFGRKMPAKGEIRTLRKAT